MITRRRFESLPPRVVEHIWRSMQLVAKTCRCNPFELYGDGKVHSVARARRMLAVVLRMTVFRDPDNTLVWDIVLSGERPIGRRPISHPELGAIMNMNQSTFSKNRHQRLDVMADAIAVVRELGGNVASAEQQGELLG